MIIIIIKLSVIRNNHTTSIKYNHIEYYNNNGNSNYNSTTNNTINNNSDNMNYNNISLRIIM